MSSIYSCWHVLVSVDASVSDLVSVNFLCLASIVFQHSINILRYWCFSGCFDIILMFDSGMHNITVFMKSVET